MPLLHVDHAFAPSRQRENRGSGAHRAGRKRSVNRGRLLRRQAFWPRLGVHDFGETSHPN